MDSNIVLYGASGHCKVIIDILQCNNQPVQAIIDDAPKLGTILDIPIIHTKQFDFSTAQNMILSIGNNKVRKRLAAELPFNFSTAIHPKAIVSNHASLGEGTVVMGGAVVNPDATIGKHCIINTGAVIEHDCRIEDYAHISPNASLAGGVTVGEGTQVGIGASVIQGIKIGKWVVIGAGAVIINDIPDNVVVVGNPGRILKK
ncbi:acetyltransferase [Flavobacterium humi]|uniref:Acetyltransferase n=1 Tax=Flavobacterium humi TaxID=2562683 RepID=A0A4Z0L7P4_9FLAO|nr:acetyltransferase [Flavobacterium humi]